MKTNLLLIIIFLLVLMGACSKQVQYFPYPNNSKPYSESVRVGNSLYLSGQLGLKDNRLVEGGTRAEVKQILKNIESILAKHQLDFNHVFKCMCLLKDIKDLPVLTEEYIKVFNENRPVRTSIGGVDLPLNASVEIECVAQFL